MRIGLDLEATMDGKTIHVVKTIDLDSGEIQTWTVGKPLMDFIEGATLLVAHNGIGYDFPMLTKHSGTRITTKVCDTLVLSRLLDPSREGGHSLESWGKRLGRHKVDYQKIWEWGMDRGEAYKGERYDSPILPFLSYYCEGDVCVLRELFIHLQKELKDKGFSEQSVELEHKVAAICKEMENNGFRLDTPKATMLLVSFRDRLSALTARSQELYPPRTFERISEKTGKRLKEGVETFNVGSRIQCVEKLKRLGWKPEKKTELGTPILDEGVLDDILKEATGEMKELAELIKEYLLLVKRIGQVESWLEKVQKDGKVHGRVLPIGAATHRAAHTDPNMAQVPNADSLYGLECRECWVAEDGWSLVGADASGFQLRALAHYMKDDDYTKAVISGRQEDGSDIHSVNQRAAGLATRGQAKTFIYAYLFGAGDAKVGSIVGGTSKDGKKLKEQFLKQTPALAALKKRIEPYCKKGYVPGLDGRKIWVDSAHKALNYLLQGAEAVVMKKAIVLFYEKALSGGWPFRLVAWVHDEVQMEVRPGFEEIVGQAFVDSIREAGEHFKLRCPLAGEYKYGKTWRDTH